MIKIAIIVNLFIDKKAFSSNVNFEELLKTEHNESLSEFQAMLPKGFHFNKEAPNKIILDQKVFSPSLLQERITLYRELPKKWTLGAAHFYICDDALTFCKTHKINLTKNTKPTQTEPQIPSATHSSKHKPSGKKNPKNLKYDKHGFILDDYQSAIAFLRDHKNKKILINFSATWCPGCLRLDHEIFPLSQFQNLTQDFIKIKLNMDNFETRFIFEKFNITTIPTILVINEDQNEISRIVDFNPMDDFENFFQGIKNYPHDLNYYKMRVDQKTVNTSETKNLNLLLGERFFYSKNYNESLRYFSQVTPLPLDYYESLILNAENEYEKDTNNSQIKEKLINVIKKCIESEPSSIRSLAWRAKFISLINVSTETKKYLNDGIKLGELLLSNSSLLTHEASRDHLGEYTHYEAFYVVTLMTYLYTDAKSSEDIILNAWKNTVSVGKKLNINGENFGMGYRFLMALTSAEDYHSAIKLCNVLMKKDPRNLDLIHIQVENYNATHDYQSAIRLGKKYLAKSKGKKEYRLAISLIKAYIGAQKSKSAKDLIQNYLNKEEISWTYLRKQRSELEGLFKTL